MRFQIKLHLYRNKAVCEIKKTGCTEGIQVVYFTTIDVLQ